MSTEIDELIKEVRKLRIRVARLESERAPSKKEPTTVKVDGSRQVTAYASPTRLENQQTGQKKSPGLKQKNALGP
jgi:hypothetical protein